MYSNEGEEISSNSSSSSSSSEGDYNTSSNSEDDKQPIYDALKYKNKLRSSLIAAASNFTLETLRSTLPKDLFCLAASYKCINCKHCNSIHSNLKSGLEIFQNKKCVSCRMRPMMCLCWRGYNIEKAQRCPDIKYELEPDTCINASEYAILCAKCLGTNRGPSTPKLNETKTRCRSCYEHVI